MKRSVEINVMSRGQENSNRVILNPFKQKASLIKNSKQ